jgi:hypothetical protein
MADKKLTPEEMGRNLEEWAFWEELKKEAEALGTKTKGEVEASITLSPEDQARAREMERRMRPSRRREPNGKRRPSARRARSQSRSLASSPPTRTGAASVAQEVDACGDARALQAVVAAPHFDGKHKVARFSPVFLTFLDPNAIPGGFSQEGEKRAKHGDVT